MVTPDQVQVLNAMKQTQLLVDIEICYGNCKTENMGLVCKEFKIKMKLLRFSGLCLFFFNRAVVVIIDLAEEAAERYPSLKQTIQSWPTIVLVR